MDKIYSDLSKVFYFQISLNELLFNDPYGVAVLKFKRVLTNVKPNIAGVWTMNQYGSTRTSLSVEVSPSQIKLCQGMAVYKYEFPQGRNTIKLTKVKNSCPSKELTDAVESVRYYRLNEGVLDFYDQKWLLLIIFFSFYKHSLHLKQKV